MMRSATSGHYEGFVRFPLVFAVSEAPQGAPYEYQPCIPTRGTKVAAGPECFTKSNTRLTPPLLFGAAPT